MVVSFFLKIIYGGCCSLWWWLVALYYFTRLFILLILCVVATIEDEIYGLKCSVKVDKYLKHIFEVLNTKIFSSLDVNA